MHLIEEGKGEYEISLLYANKTEEDILLRRELDELVENGVCVVRYTLDYPKEGWKGFKGFVNEDMFKEFGEPSKDHLLLACGPPLMMDDVRKITKNAGFELDNVFIF